LGEKKCAKREKVKKKQADMKAVPRTNKLRSSVAMPKKCINGPREVGRARRR